MFVVFISLIWFYISKHCFLNNESIQNVYVPMSSLSPSQSLIEAHDQVAAKCYEMPQHSLDSNTLVTSSPLPIDAIRMIGIQKKAGEPLVSLSDIFMDHCTADETCNVSALLKMSYVMFYVQYLRKHDARKCYEVQM